MIIKNEEMISKTFYNALVIHLKNRESGKTEKIMRFLINFKLETN